MGCLLFFAPCILDGGFKFFYGEYIIFTIACLQLSVVLKAEKVNSKWIQSELKDGASLLCFIAWFFY